VKIGIITNHFSENYDTLLQCYAFRQCFFGRKVTINGFTSLRSNQFGVVIGAACE